MEPEYDEVPIDARHSRRLGTPLRDDSLDQDHVVLNEKLEEPFRAQKPSSLSNAQARVPSTGSKRDSLGQAAVSCACLALCVCAALLHV